MNDDQTTLTDPEVERLATELWQAEQTGGTVPLPSSRHPAMTWRDARAVARAVDALRSAAGHVHLGYKLGWTSQAMRDALGIKRPNWGTLWRYQLAAGVVDTAALRHPKVEPEIVFRSAATLVGSGVTSAEVRAAADGWALGHEIVHPRFPSFDFTWLDNTADNSSSQAIVVGEFVGLSADPAQVDIAFSQDGEVRHGAGAAAMGSPAEAVAWLVSALDAEGLAVEPGQLVFTGGLAPPFDVVAGSRYRIESTALPAVDLLAGESDTS